MCVYRCGGGQRAARVPGVLSVAAARAQRRARGAAAGAGRGRAQARRLRTRRAHILHACRAAAAAPPPASVDTSEYTIIIQSIDGESRQNKLAYILSLKIYIQFFSFRLINKF